MSIPTNDMRRSERAVTDQNWIKDFLKRAAFGVIALSIDDQPFTNSNLFAYDESTSAIYFHTAANGRTPETIAKNERVCFTAGQMGRLLPAEEASEVSVEYASVVVFGRAEMLTGDEQRIYGLQRLMDKYFPHLKPGMDYAGIDHEGMEGTSVFKINIDSWSGKQKEAPVDFPGAFYFN